MRGRGDQRRPDQRGRTHEVRFLLENGTYPGIQRGTEQGRETVIDRRDEMKDPVERNAMIGDKAGGSSSGIVRKVHEHGKATGRGRGNEMGSDGMATRKLDGNGKGKGVGAARGTVVAIIGRMADRIAMTEDMAGGMPELKWDKKRDGTVIGTRGGTGRGRGRGRGNGPETGTGAEAETDMREGNYQLHLLSCMCSCHLEGRDDTRRFIDGDAQDHAMRSDRSTDTIACIIMTEGSPRRPSRETSQLLLERDTRASWGWCSSLSFLFSCVFCVHEKLAGLCPTHGYPTFESVSPPRLPCPQTSLAKPPAGVPTDYDTPR